MEKLIIILLVYVAILGVLALVIAATNHADRTVEDVLEDALENSSMQMVYYDARFIYYRETHTDVMYCERRNASDKTSLTAMIDADGTALLYSEWLEQEAETNVD